MMTRYYEMAGCLTRSKGLLAALLAILSLPVHSQIKQPPQAPAPAKAAEAPPRQNELPADTYILVGAGDIASCKYPEGAQATAKMIEKIPGVVFAAGGLAYERGRAAEFKNC